MINLYGWSPALADAFAPHATDGRVPGRVIVQHRDGYEIVTAAGELRAKISGRLLHEAEAAGYPAVGDWVAVGLNEAEGAAVIHAVLPRRTAFVRRAVIDSSHGVQVIAANIDVAFVVTSLNADLNPRRLERYLAAAAQSGARAVVVLTKSDLSEDPEGQAAEVAALAGGAVMGAAGTGGAVMEGAAPGGAVTGGAVMGAAGTGAAGTGAVTVLTVSARQGLGLEALLAQLAPGETGVLIGSSGVGKSTLINALLGEERMATQAIREDDDHGRHTTSRRELIPLPGGGLLIDTPGIREVGLIDVDEGVAQVFDDIEQLIQACRFSDCRHAGEPGCAVQGALKDGSLDAGRWAHFQKIGLETAAAEAKAEQVAKAEERRRLAALQKGYRATKRDNRGGRDRDGGGRR